VVELTALKNITGVNRLAKNQELKFSKNLTVIYGENGTGKTGYGRILKSLGFSYDPANVIHPNAYGAKEPKSATIEYTVNGQPASFLWDGKKEQSELGNISVFNNNCVQISLADRQLIVSPIGFHLFGLLTDELMAMNEMLRRKMGEYPTEIVWLPNMRAGTPQQKLISALSAKTTEEQVKAVGEFNSGHESKLEAKKKELSNLNRELLAAQLQILEAKRTELVKMEEKVKSGQALLSKGKIGELADVNARIQKLEQTTLTGLKEVAEGRGIALYDSEPFKVFLRSADSYLKTLNKPDYPVADDKCLYCQQSLDESARDLLANYKRLLNDTTQRDKQALESWRLALIAPVKALDAAVIFHQPVFGLDANKVPVQPEKVLEYNRKLSQLKESFERNQLSTDGTGQSADFAGGTEQTVDFTGVLSLLREAFFGVQKEISGITASIASIKEKAAEIQAAMDELEDRKLLAAKSAEVLRVVQNHKILDKLKASVSELATVHVSRKTSEARDLLVKQNFDDLFSMELMDLRKADLQVQVSFGTERGKSKLTQRVRSHPLNEILSEGEQKAIALAEFLTELQLDPVRAPVIFDDPVNSLDHRITDEVAKRLIRLSKTRQTIVFTHCILLLNSIQQQKDLDTTKQEGINISTLSVRNNFDETGVLGQVEELNTLSYYRDKYNDVLSRVKPGADEAILAAEGYGHLRSAIEVAVEHDILEKTIVRYRKGVAFPSLIRVKGKLIDEQKDGLNTVYERCCVFIAGHSSPTVIYTRPTIAGLRMDWEAFMKIRSLFTKKN